MISEYVNVLFKSFKCGAFVGAVCLRSAGQAEVSYSPRARSFLDRGKEAEIAQRVGLLRNFSPHWSADIGSA